MLAKILIPNTDGSPGGSFAFQEIDTVPKLGDILVFESGQARQIENVIYPLSEPDPDGADIVMRASAGVLAVHQGKNHF